MNTSPAPSKSAEDLYSQAQAAIKERKFDDAMSYLERSIAEEPRADALHDKGIIHHMRGEKDEAISHLQKAVALDPGYAQGYANLSKIMYGTGMAQRALEYMILAAGAAPDNNAYKDNLIALIKPMDFRMVFNPEIKGIIVTLLEIHGLNHDDLVLPWRSLFKLDPALAPLQRLIRHNAYPDFVKELEKLGDYSAFADPFFVLGVESLIIPDLDFEIFLTNLRRYFLEHADGGCLAGNLHLVCALGAYCFHTEFIFNFMPEEMTKAEELKTKIENAGALDTSAYDIAVLSGYIPLFRLANADDVLSHFADKPPMGTLVRYQIAEPLRELELRKTITPVTPIDNATSQHVREQYEEFPYPRWRTLAHTYSAALAFETEIKDILIAGGGTGKETLEFALAFPNARVQCIDLSLSSLSYAKRKAEERGITNIVFNQADVLELRTAFDRQFDLISSSGVLQCLDNPADGWAVLVDLLKPGGYLHIALYSEAARQDVVEARRLIAEKGYNHDAAGMRAFRADCKKIMDKRYLDSLMEFKDFFSLSECRDLIFHVKEHRHTVPQIEKLLSDHKLDFIRFNFRNPATLPQYLQEHPDDPQARNFKYWDAFEQKHPRTFVEMYDFWSRKS